MSKHDINIEILSPVHIGSGNSWKGNYEYLLFQEEAVMVIIDDEKIFDLIGEENIHHWVNIIEKEEDLLSFLRSRKSDLKPYDISKTIIPIYGHQPGIKNDIKSSIRSTVNQSPYIPGSSLKGSMRTAVLASMIKQSPTFVQDREHLGSFKKGRFQFNDGQITAEYFGGRKTHRGFIHDPNKDWLRFLRVADSTVGDTAIYRSSVVNLHYDTWKEKESSYLEALTVGTVLNGQFQIPEKQIKNAISKNVIRESTQRRLGIENLFSKINAHTLILVEDQLIFIEENENPEVFGNFENHLAEIKETLKDCGPKECVLRLGAGSSWDFITGGWAKDANILSDDLWYELKEKLRWKRYHRNVTFPKTRNLLEGGLPMGFVKVRVNE